MSNLNVNSGFLTGGASRGNRISILSFEVANTIAKGANLLQSLSEENIQFLKKEVLHSDAVQNLVSKDMKELLSIAASDKRLLLAVENSLNLVEAIYSLLFSQLLLSWPSAGKSLMSFPGK